MTGDKPDPRLRTPMQWSPRPGVGFTTGKPWETSQADSMTTNVAVEDRDPKSLLNLYRRLIHLRRQNEALAAGEMVALSTTSPQVAAYLRRTSRRAVLVVANLGAAPASGVAFGSRDSVLPPGRYTARNLLGGPNGTTLQLSRDGRIQGYVPAATLGSRESLVLDLIRR
jgi:glycosidase